MEIVLIVLTRNCFKMLDGNYRRRKVPLELLEGNCPQRKLPFKILDGNYLNKELLMKTCYQNAIYF